MAEVSSIALNDLAELVKRLPPDKLAQFEPVTGVTLVNMSKASFFEMSERMQKHGIDDACALVLRAINHETGHFIQSCMTGYMFRRNSRLLDVFNSRKNGRVMRALAWREARAKAGMWIIERTLGKDTPRAGRWSNIVRLSYQTDRTAILAKAAPAGHFSLARAMTPHFFQERQALLDREAMQDARGLSTLGVIEGGAVAYAALMEPASRDPEVFIARMERDIEFLPPLYRELWDYVYPRAVERTQEVFLPLCALALCYEIPSGAVPRLLRMLLSAPAGQAHDEARALFDNLPLLTAAGARLGAAQNQVTWLRKARLYGPFFKAFNDDPGVLDPFTLLSDPASLDKMANLPLCLTFSDGYRPANMSADEVAARMVLSHHILEVESLVRDQRVYKKNLLEFARRALNRL